MSYLKTQLDFLPSTTSGIIKKMRESTLGTREIVITMGQTKKPNNLGGIPMKAIVYEKYGSPDVLKLEDVAKPKSKYDGGDR